ncbi:MAG: DUF432 domain-containing protein [Balneolaceae bacterium]|nr:DUF432 domain-containing protein [Balneolaceae bacterium]
MAQSIWDTYQVNDGDEPLHFSLDGLHLWIKKDNGEFWISKKYADEKDLQPSVNEDNEWARWAPKENDTEIEISPVFPDLPVIVGSEFPLKLIPGAKIKIYCRIPVWMKVSVKKSDYVMQEVPAVKLSRTWFGTPIEGELCYWLTSKARRNLVDVEKKPYLINCPIEITNKSETDLTFERFCYRVERLGIYLLNNELWADETKIVYHGEEQHSDVSMTGKLPADLGKGKLISKPRNPVSKSLATRTFKMLFDDTLISAR